MDTGLDRRRFLTLTGATAATLAGMRLPGAYAAPAPSGARLPDGLFQLGVASGDPLPDRVVLWTRLAAEPLALDGRGGMPDRQIPVHWQVAHDERFQHIVREGTEVTDASRGYSVHADPTGLEPGRWYFYRFKAGPHLSPVGRTRTAPAADGAVARLAFAFVSCQNYPAGYYTAHANLAREDIDVALHLGDYIYEGGAQGSLGRGHTPDGEVRTLAEYRVRHGQYRSDTDLQAAHMAFPWIVTWDDHEVENNWADEEADPDVPVEQFLARRAAAFQAYWEHMPIRSSHRPTGPDMALYRRFQFGDLAAFHVLDTRQYRSDQPACRDADCAEAFEPGRTILGAEQEAWLVDGLRSGRSTWNVLANQVPMFEDPPVGLPADKWDGYRASRQRMMDVFAEDAVTNPLVVTGDVHQSFAADLKLNYDDPASPTVGTELVGTSVTSGGNGSRYVSYAPDANNPHIRFQNSGDRGYVRVEIASELARADYRVVSTVESPTSSVSTLASFVVQQGQPGLHTA